MIGRLVGVLSRFDHVALLAMVAVGGVHYEVHTRHFPSEPDDPADYWTHQTFADSVPTIYGFHRETERNLFRVLIGLGGVGPRSAFALMALGVEGLHEAVRHADIKRLCEVPGIGRKTAENIVKALKT